MFFDAQTIEVVGSSSWIPVLEFTGISFVCILTYLGIHTAFITARPATKVLISMFLGVVAYSLGKFVLLFFLINPLLNGF